MTSAPGLLDGHGRLIEYLRVSVTERCNLRCVYCRPGGDQGPVEDALSAADVANIVRAACMVGIRHVRLTGGEPLLREDLEDIVAAVAAIPGVADLALTTNGQDLASRARPLAAAGLRRVNISLDSLIPETYRALTGGELAPVLHGLEAALEAGLEPVKLNAVLAGRRALEWHELEAFVHLVGRWPVHVRFIEVMPGCGEAAYVPARDLLDRLRERYPLSPVAGPEGAGPARYYRVGSSPGTVGVIAPVSEPFCRRCNRLRVNARGELVSCLFSPHRLDLGPALRAAEPVSAIAAQLRRAAEEKPARWGEVGERPGLRAMHVIGG